MILELMREYVLLVTILFIIFVAALFSGIFQLMIPADKRKEMPLAVVFKRACSDTPSLIALILTLTVVALILVKMPVPTLIQDGFFLALGFYFGHSGRKKPEEQAQQTQ